MDWYYYLLRLVGEKGTPQLTPSEEEQTETHWHSLREAEKLFMREQQRDYRQRYFQRRDRIAIEAAIEFLEKEFSS